MNSIPPAPGHAPNSANRLKWLLFSLSSALLIALYHDIFWKMVLDWWDDPNYSHGFLIPIISAYLIWERRAAIRHLQLRPSVLGPVILILAGALYIIGQVAGELFTQRFSLVMTLVGLVFSWGGLPLWRLMWGPVCYLVFMIPLPYIVYDSIAFPLKLVATKASTYILQLLGVTIYSEGNLIFLPNTTLEVADACSGIRSLISVLALTVIIAKYTQRTMPKRLILMFLSIPVVLACNMLRIIITGILASSAPELSVGFFHAFSGELIFLVGVAIVFGIGVLMCRDEKMFHSERCMSANTMEPHHLDLGVRFLWPTWVSLGVMGLIFCLNLVATRVQATPLLMPLSKLPSQIDDFHRVADESMDPRIIKILGVDNYIMRAYDGPDGYPLWLYIGYFKDQKEGAMIHSPKHCYPGSGWHPITSRVVKVEIPSIGRSIRINEYLLAKGENRQLVYYWYQSRGRVIANEYEDRFFMIVDSLLKHRSDGALVRISGPVQNIEQARMFQQEFIKALYPRLQNYLPS